MLITGETGTGKDMVAAAIHKRSMRKSGPYIAVNTGAMSSELIASELFGHEKGAYTNAVGTAKGYFEEAHGGTIFLDEISTINEKAQVSLLRVLETKTFRELEAKKISAPMFGLSRRPTKIWKKRSNRKDFERIFSIVLTFFAFTCRLFESAPAAWRF